MGIALTLWLDFFNFVATGAARVLFTLFALSLGASSGEVGVLGGLLFMFPLLLSWPIGLMADRFGARGLLIGASLCGVVSLVLPFFFRNLPALYVAAALNGLSMAFFHVTLQNNIGILSQPEDRARNFSNFSLIGALTNFVGPLVAGFSIDHFGHPVACLIVATSSMIALILVLIYGSIFPKGRPPVKRDPSEPFLIMPPSVIRMLLFGAMVQMGNDLYQFYVPVYANSIGLSASVIGAILASLAVAAFIVRLFLPYMVKKIQGEILLSWVFLFGTVGYALVPLSNNAFVLGAISFVFGLGMGIGIPLTVILMYAQSAQGRSGQTLGIRLTVNNFVRVAGPTVFGVVGTAYGLMAVFWIISGFMASGGLLARVAAKWKSSV